MSAAAATRARRAAQSRLSDPASRRVRSETRTQAPSLRGGADAPGSIGGLTLGQMLTGVWEGLSTTGSATCPLCGAAMCREPGRAEGRCEGCGTGIA